MCFIEKNVVVVLISFIFFFNLLNISNAVDPCIYDLNPKGIIDLTSVGHKDGTPVWKDVFPERKDDHVYSYNPCHSFTQGNCVDVAACQAYATDEKLTYSLGTQNSVQWRTTVDQEIPTLVYKSADRTLEVSLKCIGAKESDKLDVVGVDSIKQIYLMTLSSKCACWNGCKGGSGTKSNGEISGGSIFLIIVLILLIVYLIGFMAFNKLKRKATGIDIIPHRTFWVSLPNYAVAGTKFTFGKITNQKTNYNAIP
ncbi:hypothetical protein I4U23_015586 [Adineta vaga]|nr:hypothetical protein I4U23_015586 [Adineta vaga]